MHLTMDGVQANSPEEAASLATGLPIYSADEADDCKGMTLSAIVDVQGDREFSPSQVIDFVAALDRAVAVLNMAPRFAVRLFHTDSYQIAARCDSALTLVKGGAQ
jgi:hypothetical protein